MSGIPEGARYLLNNPLPASVYAQTGGGYHESSGDDEDEGRSIERDEEASEAADDQLTINGKPVVYRFEGCDDMLEAMQYLGKPDPQHTCFLCRYVNQARAVPVPDERLASLLQTISDGIGEAWPPALAAEAAEQYAAWRGDVNSARKKGQAELPSCNAATFLEHWMLHTCDPEINQWIHLCALQYTMYKIRKCSMEQRNLITNEKSHNKDQFSIYCAAMTKWYYVSGKDPKKLSYYNEGTMMDRKGVSNGGVSRKRRPVYRFFASEKRHRVVDNFYR